MNVIFLHRVWPVYGGGETVTICLANEMVKRGFNVHIAYFKDSDSSKEIPFIDARIKAHRIGNIKFNELSGDFFINKTDAKVASEGMGLKANAGISTILYIFMNRNKMWIY